MFVDEISAVIACTARIYEAAIMGKTYEARAAFDRATGVASEACVEVHRIQDNHFDLSKPFALGEKELMLLRDHIRVLKDPMELL